MVARKNENILGIVSFNEIDVLINCVCGALIPFCALYLLIGRENVNASVGTVKVPGLTVADIIVKFKGLLLGKHAYRVNA